MQGKILGGFYEEGVNVYSVFEALCNLFDWHMVVQVLGFVAAVAKYRAWFPPKA